MPILVLRHEPFEHLGQFATTLEQHGVSYRYHDLGDPLPQEQFSGLIVMGGPMSANDNLPGLRDELSLIEQALRERIPLLGVCLGAQLIAKALGARVFQNEELEIGWNKVWFTQAAQTDPVFKGMPSPETFFHWHGETFDLPARTEWLAYSEKCSHQAYRYGDRVYGIQFHPEITAEMIGDWCSQPVNCGDMEAAGVIDPLAHDTGAAARRMIQSWMELL